MVGPPAYTRMGVLVGHAEVFFVSSYSDLRKDGGRGILQVCGALGKEKPIRMTELGLSLLKWYKI